MTLDVKWIDRGHKAVAPPDPDYPNGQDLDLSHGAKSSCSTRLVYPAQGCGYFVVSCPRCKYIAIITTAGRVDDPRSVKVPCKQ
jgi:hypothetical protein